MGPPALVTTWFGVFRCQEDKVVEARPFPHEPAAIAERLAALRDGKLLDEERELSRGLPVVTVADARLLALGNARIGPVPRGAVRDEPPRDLLHAASLELVRRTVRAGLADPTVHLVQAVSHLDESFDLENTLGERLVAWTTLVAPEVVKAAQDHASLAQLVAQHADRDALLKAAGVESRGLGATVGAEEQRALSALAQALNALVASRKPLETYIEHEVARLAPNLTEVVGPKIAARLIHHAGGLMELAKCASSTVQTLGAEKALFRHLATGAPPPKHGVLFQHPLVNRAHPKDRGPIARALAAKAVIAARSDAFGGSRVGAGLRSQVEARADQVRRVGRKRALAQRETPGRASGHGGERRGRGAR